MFGRKKVGGLQSTVRRMAKKGQAAALQTEVHTDEEWHAILERKGLVVVDIYSEWSGPCTSMVSALKKIKMEMGGDDLSYAVAQCDRITQLTRFRYRSEPTWMFIRDGMQCNISFGANSPELQELLTQELKRYQNKEPPLYSIPVTAQSKKEADRRRAMEAAAKAKEAERQAIIEAKKKKKYEDRLRHLMYSLASETCIILFPWVFKDEEGRKRDRKECPPYIELTQTLLPGNFTIEQEVREEITIDLINQLTKETNCEISDQSKSLMLEDGKALFMRLRSDFLPSENDVDAYLINLLYGRYQIPESPYDFVEDSFVQKFMPPDLGECNYDVESMESSPETILCVMVAWVPLNPRNRALTLAHLFSKYVQKNFKFEEEDDSPIVVFKYDSTKRKELAMVLETYKNHVVDFGIFERDKFPNAVLLTKSMEQFENNFEKTSYEAFICVVKKASSEAFLSFAGIGPYHVSETPEKAIEESDQYFATGGPSGVSKFPDDDNEEQSSDEEEK